MVVIAGHLECVIMIYMAAGLFSVQHILKSMHCSVITRTQCELLGVGDFENFTFELMN
jgi:hypothetical protein